MQRTLPRIKQYLLIGKNIEANGEITHLIEGQKRYGDEKNLPSDLRMELERAYNDYGKPMAVAIICFILTPLFWFSGRPVGKIRKNLRLLGIGLSAVALVFVAGIMGAVWYLSGHVPLSNGPETMLLMAFLALWGTLLTKNNEYKSALTLIAGVSLSVASMGGSTPQIGLLMPVLGSPLLSVHVLLVMTSYVLFMLMALLSAAALLSHSEEKRLHIRDVNLVLLTPAVFLLAGGIFIGAVWANQSWGRYWGWDPKETCAVVMLLIYSVPLHWGSGGLRCFRKPRILHIYLLGAVLTVIFTYFGANYLLPGMHSYA